MTSYLLFSLFGPMASWGDVTVGETRPSFPYPTKSAIVGLCAAALGIERHNNEGLLQLSKSINFAVCIERQGEFMMDYHTTQVPSETSLKKIPHNTRRQELAAENLKTILSTRDYYCDALYTVILWQNGNDHKVPLEQIEQALKKPRFVLYLGRKSCPLAMSTMPKIIVQENIESALNNYYADPERQSVIEGIFNDKKSKQNRKVPRRLYSDKGVTTSLKLTSDQIHIRKDKLLHRGAWQYTDREEYMYYLLVNEVNS